MTRTLRSCDYCAIMGENCENWYITQKSVSQDAYDAAIIFADNNVRNGQLIAFGEEPLDWEFIQFTQPGNDLFTGKPLVRIYFKYRIDSKPAFTCNRQNDHWDASVIKPPFYHDKPIEKKNRRRASNKQKGMKKSLRKWMKIEILEVLN